MILTGNNQNAQRKTFHSATFSTSNPTRTDLGLDLGLHGERQVTNFLSSSMALKLTRLTRQNV
jgi:hypothetical protein